MLARHTYCSLLFLACLLGCQPAPLPQPTTSAPERLSTSHLPNAYRIHPKVISGGLPDGDPAFQELANLGVKTIISVDGATPDVALAKKHGLRYVHLPHGYDGVPSDRAKQLAKAVHDLPGPIYIHCHHGKHRSPTAAAVACVAAGLLSPTAADIILKTAGTAPTFRGLYQSARAAKPLTTDQLNQIKADFPETATIPPMAEAMVAIEHKHDALKQIAAANWRSPPDHPDLDPAHEALLLREEFEELLRTPAAQAKPPAFLQSLQDSHTATLELEQSLTTNASPNQLTATLHRITTHCTLCHQQFRDIPLGEKSTVTSPRGDNE
jgi:protein tyrosine phosphatase (PTP) superfamily phosphohydrolase (DUF442 family)